MTDVSASHQHATEKHPVVTFSGEEVASRDDVLAVEEPLEILVQAKEGDVWLERPIAVTMRTPGDDVALALGFLHTEVVVRHMSWVRHADHAHDMGGGDRCNTVRVTLKEGVPFDVERLTRHTFTSSSCGVCGKKTIDAIRARHVRQPVAQQPLSAQLLPRLVQQLEASQQVFQETGGLHASALFDGTGKLLLVREDVGRHNALDKLVGLCLQTGKLPADDHILLLSGRASFELIQKAAIAGIPHVVAIGPPSTLAVSLAQEFGMTLVGFLRGQRFNVYTGMVS